MISEHQCEFAVQPDNPAAFVDALERAAGDRTASKDMVKHRYELPKQKFNMEMLSDQWVDWVTGVKF
jgi:hypothetical protein